MDGYLQLAAAIVERAVIDYQNAITQYDEFEINSLEKFFCSEWFQTLSDLDGRTIIRKVKCMEVVA